MTKGAEGGRIPSTKRHAPQKNRPGLVDVTFTTRTREVCRRLGAGLVVLFAVAPRDALAEPPHYAVELSAAPNLPACAREGDFLGLLDTHLDGPLLEPPTSRVLRVHVGRTRRGDYAVDLTLEEADGRKVDAVHKEYPATTCCYEVLHHAALVAAIHMEHGEEAGNEAPSPPPPAAPAPCPAAPPPVLPPSPPARAPAALVPRSDGRRFEVVAGAVIAIGAAPEVVPGPQLGLAWRWGRGSVELDLRYTPPIETRPLGPTVFEVFTASGAIVPCFRPGPFAVCGVVIGGITGARVIDRLYPTQAVTGFVGVGARVGMERELVGPLRVRADLDVAVSLLRSRINASNRPEAWRMLPVTIFPSVSFVASFR
ncbi:hypothetical protein [Polyangium aurulentum]|uniref:hypothetical protein n=1 Tax=Polyangium aurulentum TaxID=2567896 RepID=UPI00200D2DEC|nr:hypothetical protein [Polyangium aurulentum]UQA62798.1 hypothetical protein E8A73_021040 [Polyangium aurulentum]